ncbi:MAG TPA: DUF177 domain-containing protein [Candidatus Limnocylindria bacterium]|jgi:uncharacterized protein
MTVLNVAGLLREAPGAVRELRLRDRYLSLGPDVELAGPLNGTLTFQRTNRGILVRGEIEAPVRRTCARCLEAFVEPTGIRISEEFLPSIDPETGMAVERDGEDQATLLIDDHHEIDLTPVIREEFALTEPMHPLCRPDCPGLCAECGARLDGDHVPHATDEIDPRLAGLARFLDRDS